MRADRTHDREPAAIFEAFTAAVDAAGRWEVEVPTPLGRLRFDVRITADGRVTAHHRGHALPVPAMRLTPEGDGVRATWTQRITVPVRTEVAVDALVVGDRLTGTASAGSFLRPIRIEGRRVG